MTAVKAPGKWIRGLERETPLPEAARAVLAVRLKAVEDMLPLADQRAAQDEEYVHQLRVATRRSGAALRIFGPCVRKADLRRMRRRLRRLRRAAGDARECDVHRAILAADRVRIDGALNGALALVIDRLEHERRAAQQHIHRVAERYPVERLRRGRRRLLENLRAPGGGDLPAGARLADAARDIVPRLVEKLRAAADADLTVLANLHELRIAGKRLRYALEIFRSCAGDRFADAYAAVEALQEKLGAINDSNDMVNRVEAIAAGSGAAAALEPAIDLYSRQRSDRAAAFLAGWRDGAGESFFRSLDGLCGAPPRATSPLAVVDIQTALRQPARPPEVEENR